MATAITLAQAQEQLTHWLDASKAVARNQSYSIGGRQLTRADAAVIRDNIDYWEKKVEKLGRKAGKRVTQLAAK